MTFTIQGRAVKVRTASEGFDKADAAGAKSLKDQHGITYIKLEGEWYGL